ncbi:MAG: glycerate kinase [Pseudomonadota bacterium]
MKIVIAPDSFKGTLTAAAAAAAIAAGLKSEVDGLDVVLMPLSDGGEGLTEILTTARGGHYREIQVCGPHSQRIVAKYGLIDGGATAVLEAAQACGLTLVGATARDPWRATSFGFGEMIVDAIEQGAKALILGVGGTASMDGGLGVLQALGARVTDEAGRAAFVPANASILRGAPVINIGTLTQVTSNIDVTIASDVENPLIGALGAARIFGPQKGADSETIRLIDSGLSRLYGDLERRTRRRFRHRRGFGAGGGIAAGLASLLPHVRLVRGVDLVLDQIGFSAAIKGADWVVTGEGRIDAQSFRGKVLSGVCRALEGTEIRVAAIGGTIDDQYVNDKRFAAMESCLDVAGDLDDFEMRAEEKLRSAARRLAHRIRIFP